MEKLNIPDKRGEDTIESGKVVQYTNFNAPMKGGYTLTIPENQVPMYQKYYDVDNNYFIDRSIGFIVIVKMQEYADFIRQSYKKEGGDKIPLVGEYVEVVDKSKLLLDSRGQIIDPKTLSDDYEKPKLNIN